MCLIFVSIALSRIKEEENLSATQCRMRDREQYGALAPGRTTLCGKAQLPEQGTSTDVPGFEPFRAHHPHRNHGVMSLRPRDA